MLSVKQKMPLVVTSAGKIDTVGNIDYMLSLLGRPEKAVCNGDFSCCQLGHTIDLGDGRVYEIPCDKDKVLPVIQLLYENKCAHFRSKGQRLMFQLLSSLGLTVYAGSSLEDCHNPRPDETIDQFLERCLYKDLDDKNEIGDSPLPWAMVCAHPNVVKQIVRARPDLIAARSNVQFSALMMGVYRPDAGLDEILLDKRFSALSEINAQTGRGVSVLDRAANNGFERHVTLLLQLRADVDPRRLDNGYTPLMSAAESGHLECCRILLAHGADPNVRGLNGETTLQLVSKLVTLLGSDDPDAKSGIANLLKKS